MIPARAAARRASSRGSGVLERVGDGQVVQRNRGGGRGRWGRRRWAVGWGRASRGGSWSSSGRGGRWSSWSVVGLGGSAAAWAGRSPPPGPAPSRPSITRLAASTMHAPALEVYPDLTPITPPHPDLATRCCGVCRPAAGSPAVRATIWAKVGMAMPTAGHPQDVGCRRDRSGGRSRWRRRSGCRWSRATRPARSS